MGRIGILVLVMLAQYAASWFCGDCGSACATESGCRASAPAPCGGCPGVAEDEVSCGGDAVADGDRFAAPRAVGCCVRAKAVGMPLVPSNCPSRCCIVLEPPLIVIVERTESGSKRPPEQIGEALDRPWSARPTLAREAGTTSPGRPPLEQRTRRALLCVRTT